MRVLICGDRNWDDGEVIEIIVSGLSSDCIIVEGDARGADRLGGEAAEACGLDYDVFPANWNLHHRAAGPIRNQEMLNSGIDLAFAFHDNITESKGTKDMVKRLKKAGVRTYVISRP